jgi:NodT family efflux transporter outer membrane factor (OMF) lipoprotein
MLKIFIVVACLLLNSCMMVGPNYKEPKKQVAEHWAKKDASVKEAPLKDTQWWTQFHDPTLSSIIDQSYHNNLTVQAAGIKILQARAQLAQSVGQLYPQQQAALGNLTYTRIGGTSLQNVLPSNFDTMLLGLSANWELDFWGKYRRAVQASDAAFLESLAAYDNALVTLTSDVATTYIKIRTYQEQIKITKANIVVQKIGLKIARARYNAGQTSLVDVEQAMTELAQTEASLPSIVANLQKQKDALAVLLGTIPNGIDAVLVKSKGIPQAPRSIVVGIPKEAMARRPDIQQARLDAVGQSAAIGATAANLYPALSLNGAFAFSSNTIGKSSLTDIFQWSNRNVIAGPSFTWPILNYGQITNAVRAQDAVFQQALFNYMNLVLKAQQEVQDNITAYIEAKKAEKFLEQANKSAVMSLKLALVRYKEGETDFTPVLNAEQQQLSVQTSLVTAQGDIPQALVALYRALGGGWGIRGCNDVVSPQIKAEMAARTGWGTLLKQQNHQPPATRAQRLKQLYLPKW